MVDEEMNTPKMQPQRTPKGSALRAACVSTTPEECSTRSSDPGVASVDQGAIVARAAVVEGEEQLFKRWFPA